MRNIENKIATAIVIIADKSAACRHALDRAYQRGVDPRLGQPLQDKRAKRIISDRADKNARSPGARRLVNEDARCAGRKWPGICARPAVMSGFGLARITPQSARFAA